MLYLTDLTGHVDVVTNEDLHLGRSHKCGVALPATCVTVSQHHATIRRSRTGGYYIVDSSSRGTVLNEEFFRGGSRVLHDGDEIMLGTDKRCQCAQFRVSLVQDSCDDQQEDPQSESPLTSARDKSDALRCHRSLSPENRTSHARERRTSTSQERCSTTSRRASLSPDGAFRRFESEQSAQSETRASMMPELPQTSPRRTSGAHGSMSNLLSCDAIEETPQQNQSVMASRQRRSSTGDLYHGMKAAAGSFRAARKNSMSEQEAKWLWKQMTDDEDDADGADEPPSRAKSQECAETTSHARSAAVRGHSKEQELCGARASRPRSAEGAHSGERTHSRERGKSLERREHRGSRSAEHSQHRARARSQERGHSSERAHSRERNQQPSGGASVSPDAHRSASPVGRSSLRRTSVSSAHAIAAQTEETIVKHRRASVSFCDRTSVLSPTTPAASARTRLGAHGSMSNLSSSPTTGEAREGGSPGTHAMASRQRRSSTGTLFHGAKAAFHQDSFRSKRAGDDAVAELWHHFSEEEAEHERKEKEAKAARQKAAAEEEMLRRAAAEETSGTAEEEFFAPQRQPTQPREGDLMYGIHVDWTPKRVYQSLLHAKPREISPEEQRQISEERARLAKAKAKEEKLRQARLHHREDEKAAHLVRHRKHHLEWSDHHN